MQYDARSSVEKSTDHDSVDDDPLYHPERSAASSSSDSDSVLWHVSSAKSTGRKNCSNVSSLPCSQTHY